MASISLDDALLEGPKTLSLDDAMRPAYSLDEAMAVPEGKKASWYETISSLPERVVQGARAMLPN